MPELEPNGTPAASVEAGQQPTNGTPTTSDTTAQQTPAANAPEQSNEQINNPAAKAAAEEAAKYRKQLRDTEKRLAEFEEAHRKAEEAKLSETERLQKRLAEYQAKESQLTLQAQERILRAEVRAEAIQRGINPALAARIIDFAQVEYDEETGDPKNIAALLTSAITEYGLTAAQPGVSQQGGTPPTNGSQAPATPNVGATSPTRQNGPLVVTANQYLDPNYRSEFYKTHGMDLMKAVNAGKVTIV